MAGSVADADAILAKFGYVEEEVVPAIASGDDESSLGNDMAEVAELVEA